MTRPHRGRQLKLKLTAQYAGKQSIAFWDEINGRHPELYILACALQNIEYHILNRLAGKVTP